MIAILATAVAMMTVTLVASANMLSWLLLPLEHSIFPFRGSPAIEVLLRRDRSGASEVAFLVVAGFGFCKPKYLNSEGHPT